MENPIAISNYFINKANSIGETLTPMKVLKLAYLAHGWYLGLNNGEALIPEFAQAWKYGPVVQSVYDAFKHYKGSPIVSLGIDVNTWSYPVVTNKEVVPFLDKIWDVYGKYGGLELSAITHQPGSPWDQVWNKEGGKHNLGVIIPNEVIADYYQKRAEA
jgi:uncharacterized phage-associated protein